MVHWVARSVALRCYLQIFLKILFENSDFVFFEFINQRIYLCDFSFCQWTFLGPMSRFFTVETIAFGLGWFFMCLLLHGSFISGSPEEEWFLIGRVGWGKFL